MQHGEAKNSGVQVRKEQQQDPRQEDEVDDKEPQGERSGEDHATPDEKTVPAAETRKQPRACTCTP